MDNLTLYFAYGSNLHPARLENRIGRCSQGTLAFLYGARLTFSKRGLDGSGKCNIEFTESPNDTVVGVLYSVSARQRKLLDYWEATTCGYTTIVASVESNAQTLEAFTYQASDEHIDPALLPLHWYKRFVVLGASYFNFPKSYIRRLEQQLSIPDPDLDRNRQNGVCSEFRVNVGQRPAFTQNSERSL